MSAVDTIRNALFGNPPTPTFKPSREGALQAVVELNDALAAIGSSIAVSSSRVYSAFGSMVVDLSANDGTIAIVYGDSDLTRRGLYIKVGPSGSGYWFTTGLLTTGPRGPIGLPGPAGFNVLTSIDNRGDKLLQFVPGGSGTDVVATVSAASVATLVAALLPAVAPAQTVVSAIPALTGLAKSGLANGVTVYSAGYTLAGDGGGGVFRWVQGDTTATIKGMILAADEGGSGRWFRLLDGQPITDRMCGAKVDGSTYDDASIAAIAAYLAFDPKCRCVRFIAGQRRILATGASASADIFSLTNIDGVTIDWSGAIFLADRTFAESVATGNSSVFRFNNCKNINFVGKATFNGPISLSDIAGSGSAFGTYPVIFENNCSGATCSLHAVGMAVGILCSRNPLPTIAIDNTFAVIIKNGGTGYVVGDTINVPNIGSVATTVATFTVASVSGGAVTSLTPVNAGRYPAFFLGTVAQADDGVATTGGTGTGLKISPYTFDIDAGSQTRNFNFNITGSLLFYGYNAQWNGSDGFFSVDVSPAYRAFFVYGCTETAFFARVGDQKIHSIIGTAAGTETSVRGRIEVLPTFEPSFSATSAVVDIAMNSAIAGRLTADLDFIGGRVRGDSCSSAYLTINKYAQGGNDWQKSRGHMIDLSIGGDIRGAGVNGSALGANIIGTNANATDASWLGEFVSIRLKDGLKTRMTGTKGVIFNFNAIRKFVIGSVDMDCPITIISSGTGGATNPSILPNGPVKIANEAIFTNRNTQMARLTSLTSTVDAVPGFSGVIYDGSFNSGTTTINLPVAKSGLSYRFVNSRAGSGARMDIKPNGTEQIGDGDTYGGGGKKLQLTGPGASAILECFADGLWHITGSSGTRTFET